DLYIAEVQDVGGGGETDTAYGRVFYTKGKLHLCPWPSNTRKYLARSSLSATLWFESSFQ
ncbi:MAG: hypothetical protein WA450_18145, partial [Candidatus Acidiferrales bacterium]